VRQRDWQTCSPLKERHEGVRSIGGLVDEDYHRGVKVLRQCLEHLRDRFETASGRDQRNYLPDLVGRVAFVTHCGWERLAIPASTVEKAVSAARCLALAFVLSLKFSQGARMECVLNDERESPTRTRTIDIGRGVLRTQEGDRAAE
jgi:hypothetical protein